MKITSIKKILKPALLAMACTTALAHANLSNFGEPNASSLAQVMSNNRVHIVQLGDSHTAGDGMTDAMRERLQAVMGDGGMGWAMPMYFSGQRLARFGYDNVSFEPISSRTRHDENYTLGGLIARPKTDGASLTLKAKKGSEPTQKILVSIRQNPTDGYFSGTDADGRQFTLQTDKKDGSWQLAQIEATLPLTLYNHNANGSAIGGFWAFNANGQGAVVSALGINGAQLAHWDRWNASAWQSELGALSPDLIILAYGTNEAYGGVTGERVREVLTEKIRQIRTASPKSAVMILGAPEALKNKNGGCGTRPTTLTEVQMAQRQVAQTERTLYWDWQDAMGGSCTMKSWIGRGLANADGVHFSGAGYAELGGRLANDLLTLRSNSWQADPSSYPTLNAPNISLGQGFLRIEN